MSCNTDGSRNCDGGELIPAPGVLLSTSIRIAWKEVPTTE
jgi:hypothetical protein